VNKYASFGIVLGVTLLIYDVDVNAALVSSGSQQTSRFRVTNQCDKTIWLQQDWKRKTNDPVVVKIPAGQSYDYEIPDIGLPSTRFWPKTGCNTYGYNCTLGESTGVPEAELAGYQKGPYHPDINSKFEATWGCLPSLFNTDPSLCAMNPSAPGEHIGSETWWNGSAVDGYTLPYSIRVTNHNSTCRDIRNGVVLANPDVDCSGLSVAACPIDANLSTEGLFNTINGVDVTHVNLQWKDSQTGTPIGCFSPCSKLTTAQGSDNGATAGGWMNILGGLIPQSPAAKMYCCPTPPVSSGECSAGPAARSSYSQSVHDIQRCNSYTYAYDDAMGLAQCGGQTRFEVVFCPTPGAQSGQNPTPTPTPTPSTVASIKMIVPTGATALMNGTVIANNQIVSVMNGAVFSMKDNSADTCAVNVNTNLQVSGVSGSLCTRLQIDNTNKTMTFPSTVAGITLQFNLNTSVGISAYLENTIIVNATPLKASDFSSTPTLKAFQASKVGTCILTISSATVQKGAGELCNRLNIVPEGTNVNIYLPADIPNTGGATQPDVTPTPTAPESKYVIFGMDASEHAYFKNNLVTNGTKLLISSLGTVATADLVAYQNQNSASCVIGVSGDTLNIVQNSGMLCNGGLVLVTKTDGDYYIGLPNPLPVPSGSKAFGLGIAQGMRVTINGQEIRWDSREKTVNIPGGVTHLLIKGNNQLVRDCPVTLQNNTLTWPSVPECAGVVVNGGVIYFPAF
jgi:hypothetical protein